MGQSGPFGAFSLDTTELIRKNTVVLDRGFLSGAFGLPTKEYCLDCQSANGEQRRFLVAILQLL